MTQLVMAEVLVARFSSTPISSVLSTDAPPPQPATISAANRHSKG